MKRKKVLITGGVGFLGGYLVQYLLDTVNIDIVVFDKLAPQEPESRRKNVIYTQGDILETKDLDRVFNEHGQFEVVYHLASAMPNKAVSDDMTWKTNVTGTASLASLAAAYGTRSFVFTSSNVTYGIPESLPVTEETAPRPLEVYGRSKLQAEEELKKFKNSMDIQIFRCPVITGVGRLGLQAILFEFISENRNVYVLGDGGNVYQFADALDVSVALEKASHRQGFDIYTIGGDGATSLRVLYQKAIDAASSRSKIVSLPKVPALSLLSLLDRLNISPLGIYQYTMISRSLYADTTKIKKMLGWKPKKTNVESFIENYRWYTKNKGTFSQIGSSSLSENRSLPNMKVFKLLKLLS